MKGEEESTHGREFVARVGLRERMLREIERGDEGGVRRQGEGMGVDDDVKQGRRA